LASTSVCWIMESSFASSRIFMLWPVWFCFLEWKHAQIFNFSQLRNWGPRHRRPRSDTCATIGKPNEEIDLHTRNKLSVYLLQAVMPRLESFYIVTCNRVYLMQFKRGKNWRQKRRDRYHWQIEATDIPHNLGSEETLPWMQLQLPEAKMFVYVSFRLLSSDAVK
jgi:hypothetical protein